MAIAHIFVGSLPETNIAPKNDGSDRNLLFQRSIFRGYVSFREGICWLAQLGYSPNGRIFDQGKSEF